MSSAEQFAGEEHSKIYAKFRRDTPMLMAEKIVSYLKEKYDGPMDLAIDVGCGSGQGTVILAPFFKKVHGSDIAESQIKAANETRARPNVTYSFEPSEKLDFPDGSAQLVTAGSALHWFNIDAFFPECRRVLCNNGVFAVYIYYAIKPLVDDPEQAAKIDELYESHSSMTLKYHAVQAKIAFNRYKDVNFPFEEVHRVPDVRDIYDGHLDDVVGYIQSWSGFQNFLREQPEKAKEYVATFERKLKAIAKACNLSETEPIKLYRDFLLIICRKTEK
ncbi:putative methyltransferase DDB_G0268948 [Uloborus diversus]|uniref:putative methyltransferase DDB_G0268948 n=1 Tax=Uloborus diversus TaxID=327109 RepID=UPI00240A60B1|nr:putative methyltransferase DDB_G0268948 [Uloborus diversus]